MVHNIISEISLNATPVFVTSIHLFMSSFNFETPAVILVEYSTKMYLPFGNSKKESGVPMVVFCFGKYRIVFISQT